MLAWAVKMSLVGRNVVSAVDAPAVRRSEAKAFEADEIARVLDAARGTRWHSFIALAFALGARRGELLALKWPVVDFERGVVRIEGSLSQTKAGVTMKGTKTDRVRNGAALIVRARRSPPAEGGTSRRQTRRRRFL